MTANGVGWSTSDLKGGTMRTYERPTLTAVGSFAAKTGLGGSGPRDLLFRHQLL